MRQSWFVRAWRGGLGTLLRSALLAGLLGTGLAACTPPKIMMQRSFLGQQRTRSLLYQQSDEAGGTFNAFYRICSLQQDGREVQCKDTLVLENVMR